MSHLLTAMTLVLCIAMIVAALVAIRARGGDSETSDISSNNASNNTDDASRETISDTSSETRELPIAILAAGLVSLIASVLFVILAAPDVAMTEAAIGSGLTTFLFFFVLNRIRGSEHG